MRGVWLVGGPFQGLEPRGWDRVVVPLIPSAVFLCYFYALTPSRVSFSAHNSSPMLEGVSDAGRGLVRTFGLINGRHDSC